MFTTAPKKRAFQARTIGPSTINNPTAEDYLAVRGAVEAGLLKFVTFNHEVAPTTGTPHLQITATASKPLTTTGWQNVLGGRVANIEATRSPQDCIDYCQGFVQQTDRATRKDGSQDSTTVSESGHFGYEEYGNRGQSGTRTDLTKALASLAAGASMRDLIETMPGTANGAYRMLIDYHRETRLLTGKAQVLATYHNVVWKPFQQHILDFVDTEPDGRTVNWYHEPIGNIGKTYLMKYLMASNRAFCPDVTKAADIFCAYNMEPIVIFDIPRSRIDTMDHLYGIIEKFLNGVIFVGKYASHTMCIKPPHVLVFSNDEPKKFNEHNHATLSDDRWHIVDITKSFATLKSHDDTVTLTKAPPGKRKEPESWKALMLSKDANPNATKQQCLSELSDVAPPFIPDYK